MAPHRFQTTQDVEIPNPMRIQRGTLLGCKAWRMLWLPKKTPSAKSGTFSKQWTFIGVQLYTGHANPLLWQVVAKFVTQIAYPVVKEQHRQHRGSHS